MLDKPQKTRQLVAKLEAALPFEVALMPELIESLARQREAGHRQAHGDRYGDLGTQAMKVASFATSSPTVQRACSSSL